MKNLTKEELNSIIAIIGNEVSNGFTAPKAGEVTIKSMTPIGERDQTDAKGVVTHINAWVRVDFNEGGSASLRSILISPDITWKEENNSQEKRIQALTGAKLTFTYMEKRESKNTGNPYKVAHFVPQTL